MIMKRKKLKLKIKRRKKLLKLFKEEVNLVFIWSSMYLFSSQLSLTSSDFVFIQHITQQKKEQKHGTCNCFFLLHRRTGKTGKLMFYQYLHAFLHVVNTISHFTSLPLSALIDAVKTFNGFQKRAYFYIVYENRTSIID